MRYIFNLKYTKLWSYILAKKIQIERNESHAHRYKYYYGLQVFFNQVNEIVLLLLLSFILGTFKETLMTLISFILIRSFAGGSHFNSYVKCAYTTIIVFMLTGLISKYLVFDEFVVNIIYVACLIILLLFAPKENKNKPIKKDRYKVFKLLAIVNLDILYFVGFYILETFKQSIVVGVMIACIVILPIRKVIKWE